MKENNSCSQAGIVENLPEGIENWPKDFLIKGYLYYGKCRMTDKPYIRYPVLYDGDNLVREGNAQVLVFGKVENGNYISTYFIYGVGFSCGTDFSEIAFAKALEDKNDNGIGLLNVKFL